MVKPGPPGGIDLWWHNTASEAGGVTFDICSSQEQQADARNNRSIGLEQKRQYAVHHFVRLDYAAEYCFKMKARTGLGSNGCVSKDWSQNRVHAPDLTILVHG